MPKSFLVRKKSCVQSRSWEDVTQILVPAKENTRVPTPPRSPEDETTSPAAKDDAHETDAENMTPKPKKQCKTELDNNHNTVKSDLFQIPHPRLGNIHLDHHGLPYTAHHNILRRDYHEYQTFPHLPLLPTFPPSVLWNPVLHSHAHAHAHAQAQSPPFLHVRSPPPWLQTPPPTSSPPTTTWMTPPYAGKPPSPVGVLSPAEIPSPSSSAIADEPSLNNSAAVPGIPVNKVEIPRLSSQSKALVQIPAPCYPIREQVPTYPKATGVSVEVINNGFGIKNPLLTNDRPRQGHTDITTVRQPSGYLLTSNTSHTCTLCGFKTDSPRLLHKHLKSHKEIKRFLCTVCGKGFNDTFDLKRHTRTHTGVRPYKCDKCGKAFTQRCSLESHCKKIHGLKFTFAFNERRTKTYVCEECGHSTNDPEEHFVHLRTQHPNNPAILRCHDRRQFKFARRKSTTLEMEEIRVS